MDKISELICKLKTYIEKENYHGWDPYDNLSSPLYKLPFFRSNKLLRSYAQQFGKRLPINLRPIFFVSKGYNPVTLGLCIQAYCYFSNYLPHKKKEFISKADFLISELKKYMRIPAYKPTIVATGIITNSLFIYYKITRNSDAIDLCKSACNFLLKDLNKSYEKKSFCFSYSPFDKEKVLNASMKGARLLSQIYSITGDRKLFNEAKNAVEFVVNKQSGNGAWNYSDKREKIDNYHTGYILDCLDEYIKCTDDKDYIDNLKIGFKFYKENFFENNGLPKFFHDQTYPIDCTAGGQAILTLTRFNEMDLAERVAEVLIKTMYDTSGYFYFRKFKYYTIKTSFMRWSNAWMFTALSYLLFKMNAN